ncbi:4-amino-4-deoxy-L-arabinose transferase [Phenylobacterium deserti]|uniref:4-amino-4-deoxy-L-arabinose transferase n=2 Tax=Phenylobacterium deserti TaxID=1914756 RepID=A0A328ATH6_9CAUL|nr:4-amino-4-deoxy-L-arabinose transferase [Phenylobacterium deserti]
MLTLGLTIVRIVALFRTPLNLYPDEAQYWLWSRTLDFGYYSKPPMIAWAIWATTQAGDAEAWVRLSAPLFQAGATLVVFAIGRRLYDSRIGLAGAALYALTPAIQLSSAVIATDAPLLFFLGLTMLAYVSLQEAEGARRAKLALGFGASLGLAFLSKYAAIYGVVGVALHLALSREARRAWTPSSAGLAVAAFLLILAPNLVWNANHGFATLHHTAANAAWGGRKLFNPGELADFLGSQVLIFGPIPFAALVIGVVLAVRRKRLTGADLLLLCFILPPLLIVSVQAFISRANANWSGASYLPGAVLAAAWLVRWRARRWLTVAFALQAALAAFFLACVIAPRLADAAGVSNSFKRAKGWDQMTAAVIERAVEEQPKGLTAIAVNSRFLYYALSYYGRNYFGDERAPPLRAWMLTGTPQNQAETSAPLTTGQGRRVLGIVNEDAWEDEFKADFAQVSDEQITRVRLDRKRSRQMELFVGEGFSPRPRDPATGLPTPP